MQIFLPPSEGKTAVEAGEKLDLTRLSFAGLEKPRSQVIVDLECLCQGDPQRALAALKLSARQEDQIALNASLTSAPAAEAWQVYSGVLYQQCDIAAMPPEVRDAAHERLVIFSGLWGILRTNDRIPAYRCSAATVLPNLSAGKLSTVGAFWRKHLKTYLREAIGDEFILDMRSGPYAKMWQPDGDHATVRVLQERVVNGRTERSVVSHFNKATKGRIVADLLAADAQPGSMQAAADALRDLKYRVEADEQARRLDIVVDEP